MGAIAGYLALDELGMAEGSSLLSRMLDALSERPVGGARGTAVGREFGIGLRRWALPGETAAPWRSPRGDVVVAVDGRLRFLDPAPVLGEPGSPPEALVRALHDRHEEAFPARLDGAFALALWDGRARRLMLARDRFGQRPLFVAWARGGRALLFASEAKALLSSGRVDAALDGRAVLDVLSMGHPLPPRTLFAGIESIPPGSWLTLDLRGREARGRWFDPPYPRARGPSPTPSPEGQLETALARSLPGAGERVGVLLDDTPESVLLAALMAEGGPGLRTFTPIVEGAPQSESAAELADAVAARLGSEHAPIAIGPVDGDDVVRVLRALEVPCLDPEPFFSARVHAAASLDGRAVLVGGLGADAFWPADALRRVGSWAWPGPLGRFALGLVARRRPGLPRSARAAARLGQAFLRRTGAIPPGLDRWGAVAHLADALLTRRYPPPPGISRFPIGPEAAPLQFPEAVHRRLVAHQRVHLDGRALWRSDRLAGGPGVELCLPFLGIEVVQLSARVAPIQLVGAEDRALIRAALPRALGGRVRRRRPRPFAPPSPIWPFGLVPPEWARSALSERTVRELGLFEPEPILAAVERLARPGAGDEVDRLEAAVLRGIATLHLLARALGVGDVRWPGSG